jgi:hypothetical protein
LDSDTALKQEIADAKVNYQKELERHSKRLNESRKNPKYDLVLAKGRIPSAIASRDRAAYARYKNSRNAGSSHPEAMVAMWNRSTDNSRNSRGIRQVTGSGNRMYVTANTRDPREMEAIRGWMMGYNELPTGVEVRNFNEFSSSSGGNHVGGYPINQFGGGGGQWVGLSGGMGSMVDASMRSLIEFHEEQQQRAETQRLMRNLEISRQRLKETLISQGLDPRLADFENRAALLRLIRERARQLYNE